MDILRSTVVLAISVASLASAGTIRHDRSDQVHTAGSNDPVLAAVCQLVVNGSPNCSGTLIAPQWVLTAAHCFWPTPRSAVISRQTVVIAGRRFEVGPNDIFINPGWVNGGFDVLSTFGDIALIRLPRPISNVAPIGLNRGADEVGQRAFIVGFGSTGTGLTGNIQRTAVKRIGMNIIDATASTISFPEQFPFQRAVGVGSGRALLTDFDSPNRNVSTLGSESPLNLEYTTASGDSGGPLLLQRNRIYSVAGVTSGGIDGFTGFANAASFYSDTATFTRVTSYIDWVERVMAGRELTLERYLQSLGRGAEQVIADADRLHRQRHQELRDKGWRLTLRTPQAFLHASGPARTGHNDHFSGRNDSSQRWVESDDLVGPDDAVFFEQCPCQGSR